MALDLTRLRGARFARAHEAVMTALAAIFAVLLVVQYLGQPSIVVERRINLAFFLIWAAFAIDFFVRLALAPSKLEYLRHNWIAAIALALPAFRVFRIFQAAQSMQVAGLISSGKRGNDLLRRMLGVHPFLYIGILTLMISTLSTLGMYSIEHSHRDANIRSVGDAIWWTTATLTTIGSELFPVTPEGRTLAIFVMVYSLGFAGYVAGTFAAVLLGSQQEASSQPDADTAALVDEIRALRRQLQVATTNGLSASESGDAESEARDATAGVRGTPHP